MNFRCIVAPVALLLAVSCSGSSDSSSPATPSTKPAAATADEVASTTATTPTSTTAAATTAVERAVDTSDWTVTASVQQVLISDATPGASISLTPLDADPGAPDLMVAADENGFALFRNVGGRVAVYPTDDPSEESTDVVEVLATTDHPEQTFYDDQTIEPGFGYIATRDGTTLSATVTLPGPVDAGPYPTVVEYSGYAPSNPGDTTFAQLFNGLGFAYVGVNIRGSGCSGGAYGYFEAVQTTDGYDVVEAIAAQPWVQHGHVGMVGISYPGISQLFVAQTQPPHLAAITPLSVLDDSYRATLYPGGILNTGFAVAWSSERQASAKPYGQEWTVEQAKDDPICADNQRQRGQNQDLVGLTTANPFYDPTLGDPITPATFVDEINVPVFIAGAWQDEQTGGHFATMLDQFTSAPRVYASLVNGMHTESLASVGIFPRFVEFLHLYVARKAPDLGGAGVIVPILTSEISGVSLSLPERRSLGGDFDTALAAFEAEPSIEVLFEEGAAEGTAPGSPAPRFVAAFDEWPVPSVEEFWELAADGTMTTATIPASGEVSYTADPSAVAEVTVAEDANEWAADVVYDWQVNPAGTAAVFTSEPVERDLVAIGSGVVALTLAADATDTDVEVTLSEIRPDGSEVYVQSGWLRASHRAEVPPLGGFRPIHSHLEADAEPLTPGESTVMRVELFPFAHAFRAGSRLRLTVDAPGGNRVVWAFDTISDGETVTITTGGEASWLGLRIVEGVEVPPTYPACGSLRGQPCRPAS